MDIAALGLPTWALVAIGLVIVVQLALQIAAIVDIARRPPDRIRGSKVVWAIVVVLGEIFGAIAYFAVGRRGPPVEDTGRASLASHEAVERATRVLYGDGPEAPPRT